MAGIDLRFTRDGEVYCFEVNPSPVYSYYEARTGQAIASAVAEYLMGRGQVLVYPLRERECSFGSPNPRPAAG
jgi:glutathione synthase/RimK-type ligase-like ATP-grasp enzyme